MLKKGLFSRKAVDDLRAGPPEIPRSEILFNPATDKLGGGAFGDVYKAVLKGIHVAVKVPKKQQWSSPEELALFREEVAILRTIFHTNVVLFLGACTAEGNVMIVLEKMVCDVDVVLRKPAAVPPELKKYVDPVLSFWRKLKIAHDAVVGINWLHDILHIVHRDLKPANLLLDESFRVKVSDFGFSQFYNDKRTTKNVKGTKLYLAPEIWAGQPATTASDIYALGYILWEIYTEEESFSSYTDLEPFYRDVIVGGLRPPIPATVPHKYWRDGPPPSIPTLPSMSELITSCWDANPAKRPSISQVLLQLEIVMLESQIDSPSGRLFWSKHFGSVGKSGGLQESVAWEEFCTAVSKETTIGPNFAKLSAVLCEEGAVTMAKFNMAEKWFGAFYLPENLFIVAEMETAIDQPWFMPDASKAEADLWLAGRDDGTFLIRLSNSNPGTEPFTMSRRRGGVTTHRRIQRLTFANTAERYSCETSRKPGFLRAPTLTELIDALMHNRSILHVCPRAELGGSLYS
ncbi:SHK1 protein [Pelomyxa schiedti]|nr:SHK1 protein [Pelomyxa schiedti]